MLRLGLLVIGLTLALAPASLAQDQSATLDAANPKFTWESTGSGAPDPGSLVGEAVARCAGAPIFTCEYILFDIKAPGQLSLTLDSTTGVEGPGDPTGTFGEAPLASLQDLDGYLYASNAAGEPQGDALSNGDAEAGEPDCVTSYPSEACTVPVQAGFYVLEVEYYAALEAPYVGTAELLGAAAAAPPPPGEQPPPPPPPPSEPPPPPPPPPSEPQGQEQSKRSAAKRRKACKKKAKKIKNKRKRSKALKRCKKIRG